MIKYEDDNWIPKYVKQKLTELKLKIDKSMCTVNILIVLSQ